MIGRLTLDIFPPYPTPSSFPSTPLSPSTFKAIPSPPRPPLVHKVYHYSFSTPWFAFFLSLPFSVSFDLSLIFFHFCLIFHFFSSLRLPGSLPHYIISFILVLLLILLVPSFLLPCYFPLSFRTCSSSCPFFSSFTSFSPANEHLSHVT